MKRPFLLVFSFALFAVMAWGEPGPNPKLSLPSFTKVRLTNGITLFLVERHQVPLVSFSFLIKTGSVGDPVGKEGLASLTAGLLRKGTASSTADQISEQLDFLGGAFSADVNLDYTSGRAEFMKKDVDQGAEFVANLLIHPVFPEPEFQKLVAQRVDGIRSAKDQAQAVLGRYFYHELYGSHPYGRQVGGFENSLKAITRADVVQFHEDYYTPDNLILAVAGDFSAPEMQRLIEAKFDAWRGKAKPAPTVATPESAAGKSLLLVDKPDSTQTFFMVGDLGVTRNNPDRTSIEVVNTLFGGRFTSLINTELRIKTGLTYGASSSFRELLEPGPFVIASFTKNETTEQALDKTLEVLARFHERGITQQELDSAKQYIKGQFPPEIETSDDLAGMLVTLEFYGLDHNEVDQMYDRIDRVDLATAARIIDQYFPKENLTFCLIGKAADIGSIAKKYAPILTQRKITDVGF